METPSAALHPRPKGLRAGDPIRTARGVRYYLRHDKHSGQNVYAEYYDPEEKNIRRPGLGIASNVTEFDPRQWKFVSEVATNRRVAADDLPSLPLPIIGPLLKLLVDTESSSIDPSSLFVQIHDEQYDEPKQPLTEDQELEAVVRHGLPLFLGFSGVCIIVPLSAIEPVEFRAQTALLRGYYWNAEKERTGRELISRSASGKIVVDLRTVLIRAARIIDEKARGGDRQVAEFAGGLADVRWDALSIVDQVDGKVKEFGFSRKCLICSHPTYHGLEERSLYYREDAEPRKSDPHTPLASECRFMRGVQRFLEGEGFRFSEGAELLLSTAKAGRDIEVVGRLDDGQTTAALKETAFERVRSLMEDFGEFIAEKRKGRKTTLYIAAEERDGTVKFGISSQVNLGDSRCQITVSLA